MEVASDQPRERVPKVKHTAKINSSKKSKKGSIMKKVEARHAAQDTAAANPFTAEQIQARVLEYIAKRTMSPDHVSDSQKAKIAKNLAVTVAEVEVALAAIAEFKANYDAAAVHQAPAIDSTDTTSAVVAVEEIELTAETLKSMGAYELDGRAVPIAEFEIGEKLDGTTYSMTRGGEKLLLDIATRRLTRPVEVGNPDKPKRTRKSKKSAEAQSSDAPSAAAEAPAAPAAKPEAPSVGDFKAVHVVAETGEVLTLSKGETELAIVNLDPAKEGYRVYPKVARQRPSLKPWKTPEEAAGSFYRSVYKGDEYKQLMAAIASAKSPAAA